MRFPFGEQFGTNACISRASITSHATWYEMAEQSYLGVDLKLLALAFTQPLVQIPNPLGGGRAGIGRFWLDPC
jgi:hypothetical protein